MIRYLNKLYLEERKTKLKILHDWLKSNTQYKEMFGTFFHLDNIHVLCVCVCVCVCVCACVCPSWSQSGFV